MTAYFDENELFEISRACSYEILHIERINEIKFRVGFFPLRDNFRSL